MGWKMDADMPTGCYKDRGVSVMVNGFRHHGYRTVMDDSSGNAGVGLACCAARVHLHARIFVPADAPQPKKSQIAIYGAEWVKVEGPRFLAAAATANQSLDMGYALHPAFLLGRMSAATDPTLPPRPRGPSRMASLSPRPWRHDRRAMPRPRCGVLTRAARTAAPKRCRRSQPARGSVRALTPVPHDA